MSNQKNQFNEAFDVFVDGPELTSTACATGQITKLTTKATAAPNRNSNVVDKKLQLLEDAVGFLKSAVSSITQYITGDVKEPARLDTSLSIQENKVLTVLRNGSGKFIATKALCLKAKVGFGMGDLYDKSNLRSTITRLRKKGYPVESAQTARKNHISIPETSSGYRLRPSNVL